jgi:hypothetical protein
LNLPTTSSGVETHAYTDAVCMALLEYYSFDAGQWANATALRNFRILARQSFRAFIYAKCGYDPDRHIPDSWANLHERILLNDQIPVGYFSIFREIADLVVHMIKAGCPLDEHTVPDISVGKIWADHWGVNGFDEHYGNRRKHPHVYPDWFPQAAVNPVPAWIYPVTALGVFHNWMHAHYIPLKFPKYVENKVKAGVFLPGRGQQLVAAASARQLPAPN